MRGAKVETQGMFSYLSPEQRVQKDHPLRTIRIIVDQSLAKLDGHFNQIYSDLGRPSIPPEHLLRQENSKASLKGRRKMAAWDNRYMEQVLTGIFHA